EPLARIDLVRVLEHGAVGFEDLVVLVGVAVELLGDLGQGVARLDLVEGGLGRLLGGLHLIVDAADPLDVSDQQGDLLPDLLAGRAAREGDLVVVDPDAQVVDVEAHVLHELHEGRALAAIVQLTDLLRRRLLGMLTRLRRLALHLLVVVPQPKLPAHVLRELNQTHVVLLSRFDPVYARFGGARPGGPPPTHRLAKGLPDRSWRDVRESDGLSSDSGRRGCGSCLPRPHRRADAPGRYAWT